MEHHWLEYISWIANGILAVVACFALVQVKAAIQQAKSSLEQTKLLLEQVEVSRQDIALRSRREALALALDQCKRFAETIIPHFESVYEDLRRKDYIIRQVIDPSFPTISKEQDPLGVQIWMNNPALRVKIRDALNELESLAMYFACDLADEEVAFTPIGQSFCNNCEACATFIGVFRQKDKVKLYQNVVKLYGIWKPRVERTALEEQGKLLEEKKSQLPPDKRGIPLGTKIK